MLRSLVLVAAVLLAPATAHAQFTVFDPTNHAQAILRLQQLQQMYTLAMQQARQLPAALHRYSTTVVPWVPHDISTVQIAAYLDALNRGDPRGQQYRTSVEPLALIQLALNRAPQSLRSRLSNAYGTIEMADSVAALGVDGAGKTRAHAQTVLNAIRALETDTLSPRADYHSQVALLDKLTGAAELGLRLQERSGQLTAHALEQLLVENKRKRETEAALMNARIHQWQHGIAYGAGLTQHTAQRLDAWRQP
jgi:hypothetical protein